jgi:pyruvate,water dikinase
VGLCGQAPSDLPEFTQYLIAQGINSISFQADALLSGIQTMLVAEKKLNITQSKS